MPSLHTLACAMLRWSAFNTVHRLMSVLHRVEDALNVADTPVSENVRTWEMSVVFEATETQADEISERAAAAVCNNARCGECGEFCERQWVILLTGATPVEEEAD